MQIFSLKKPEVINEISFEKKNAVENHILMTGDAVGMISPLCGNGMAMAIHSAKMLSEIILKNWHTKGIDVNAIEHTYQKQWSNTFGKRVWVGRKIQQIFGNEYLTMASLVILKNIKPAGKFLINQTHGETFH